MNTQKQWNIKNPKYRSKNPILFYFAILIVLVLEQNPDLESEMLWWGSIGFLALTFLITYKGNVVIEGNYSAWVVSFWLFGALSIFWAVNSNLVETALKSMLINLFIFLLIRSTIQSERDIEHVLGIILISIVINVMWLLLTNQNIYASSGGLGEVLDRLGADSLWNSNSIGMMAAIGMFIMLYFRKKSEKRLFRLLGLGIVALMVFVALISGSRKAVLMVLIGLCGFIFVTAKGKRLRAILIIGVIVIALYYLVMKNPFFYSIVGWRMDSFIASFTGQGTVDGSTQIREQYVTDAIRAWNERPFFGCGLDCYRDINMIKRGMYAHNNYVELLADVGLIGTTIFYSAYVYCFVKLMKIKEKNNLIWLMLLVWLIFVIMDYGCVSYNLFLNQILIMLMFSAVSIYSKKSNALVIRTQKSSSC